MAGHKPLRQLSAGLAGYEALQEGLAVFAEYAVGGLDRSRLRLLAARVVAAKMLVDGASFVDCFRVLNRDHHFKKEEAFFNHDSNLSRGRTDEGCCLPAGIRSPLGLSRRRRVARYSFCWKARNQTHTGY